MHPAIWVGSLLKKREIGRAEIVNVSSVFFPKSWIQIDLL